MAVLATILAALVVVLGALLAVRHLRATRRHATDAAEIARLTDELAATTERADTARAEADDAERRAAAAEHRADDAEAARAEVLAAQASAAEQRAATDATLWRLELARSERTWRHSVAILPDGPSPFADTDDPLRLAVETEAAALHEDVGANLAVQWDVDTDLDDPARLLLLLRTAQELLAVAAREDADVTLRAEPGDDGIVLSLTADDGSTVDLPEPVNR